MAQVSRVYVGGTNRDLRSARDLVINTLVEVGLAVTAQEYFMPEGLPISAVLRKHISSSDAVIVLIGMAYGPEPRERATGELRLSYAQLECEIARELGKPLYIFICAEDFPFDPHDPEVPEVQQLQQAYRERLAHSGVLYHRPRSREDLLIALYRLPLQLERLKEGTKRLISGSAQNPVLNREGHEALRQAEAEVDKIAISYRREDTTWPTYLLYRELCNEWGRERIFFDLDSIPAGDDFRETLQETMRRSAVLVAVIGRRWLGRRWWWNARIQSKSDWVRLEIETALAVEVPIIPILIDGARMPPKEALPNNMKPLSTRQAVSIRTGRDFEHDLEGILNGIARKSNGRFVRQRKEDK